MISSLVALRYFAKNKNINSLLMPLCIYALLIFESTEIFSLFNILNRTSIISFWSVCVVISWVYLIKSNSVKISDIKNAVLKMQIFDYIFVLWISVLGIMAWNIVPYNWDSMTYHLARVANWINNESVSFFPTGIKRQLYSPVFSEYVVTHLSLILGSDRASNMVQWAAYTINCFVLFSCCKKLDLSKYVSYFVVILYMTIPLTIAESVTTEVDLVGVLFFLVFCDSCLSIGNLKNLNFQKQCLSEVFICVTAAVIGYLVKSNVCIAMIPFLVWLLIKCIKRKDKIKYIILYCLGALLELVLVALPVFKRNYDYYGDILASQCVEKLKIGTWNPRYVIVNIFKNYSLISCNKITKPIISFVVPKIARILHVDINDPMISYTDGFPGQLPTSYGCDVATCSIVGILFMVTLIITIIMLFNKKYRKQKNIDIMIVICISCIMGMAYIKYQVWGSRLLLAFAVAMCLFVGCAIENIKKFVYDKHCVKGKFWIFVIYCILVVTSIPAFINNSRYLYKNIKNEDSRNKMYFADRNIYDKYLDVCNYVESMEGVKCIGLSVTGDMYEYPLWKMIDDTKYTIIQANNDEKLKNKDNQLPDCIIAIGRTKYFEENEEYEYNSQKYKVVYDLEGDKRYLILVKK